LHWKFITYFYLFEHFILSFLTYCLRFLGNFNLFDCYYQLKKFKKEEVDIRS
jgi:hypothetical protein